MLNFSPSTTLLAKSIPVCPGERSVKSLELSPYSGLEDSFDPFLLQLIKEIKIESDQKILTVNSFFPGFV